MKMSAEIEEVSCHDNAAPSTVQANENILENMQQESNLRQGTGPTVRDYLFEFIDYLKRRTGFNPRYFRTSRELQNIMAEMESVSLPLRIWRSFINLSIRCVGMADVQVDAKNIAEIAMIVLSRVVKFFIKWFLIKSTLWILSYFPVQKITWLIMMIYYWADFCMQKLWNYVSPKLEDYCTFFVEKLLPSSNRQIMN